MKSLSIIKFIFIFVGMIFLGIACWSGLGNYHFIHTAQKTSGTVVEVIKDKKRKRNTIPNYYPLIEFFAQDGKKYQFKSNIGSSHSSRYEVGQSLPVLYDSKDPYESSLETDNLFDYYSGALIFGFLGFVFSGLGFGMILFGIFKKNEKEFLLRQGQVIYAKFQEVALNSSLKVNGRSPFIILAQWQNPQTQEIHFFKSENLWFDPRNYVKIEEIKVYIDPNNPKKYYLDISFLPSLA